MEDKEIWLILYQAIIQRSPIQPLPAEAADEALKEYKKRWVKGEA